MIEEVGALGRSCSACAEDSTLRTQATTMLFGRWRKAATSPFPMPGVELSVMGRSACHFGKGYSDLTDLY
jgi:hypothetical protein